MNAAAVEAWHELIAEVAVRLVVGLASDAGQGTSRFVLDGLNPVHVAAFGLRVLNVPALRDRIELRLPRPWVAAYGLPEAALTDERATFHRNSPCELPIQVLVSVGDDERQSLSTLHTVGTADILEAAGVWVEVCAEGLGLEPSQETWWTKALGALHDLQRTSLDDWARYALATRDAVRDDGLPLVQALGTALPALALPRNSGIFAGIRETVRTHKREWISKYKTVIDKHAPLLRKTAPNGTPLGDHELRQAFARLHDDTLPVHTHADIEAFLDADPGWSAASATLARHDWETIAPLFDGVKREQFNLGKRTRDFFDDRGQDALGEDDWAYLRALETRASSTGEHEEDADFFERHRAVLREDRTLYARWERFVLGPAREHSDFLSGLVAAFELLQWDEPDRATLERRLVITAGRRTKRELRDLNDEAGVYFAQRYRGLPAMLDGVAQLDFGELFNYPQLLETWQATNQEFSQSKKAAAMQIDFTLELQVTTERAVVSRKAKFIWRHEPSWISSAFADDWARLQAHPLRRTTAQRDASNAKGNVSSVDLENVATLVASHGKDRGSLVGRYDTKSDLAKEWRRNLVQTRDDGYISAQVANELAVAFERFGDAYGRAIKAFVSDGLNDPAIDEQLAAYAALLDVLCRQAPGDVARLRLLRPVLEVGTVRVVGGPSAAIIAPWHPLRFGAMRAKAERVTALCRSLVTGHTVEQQIGDRKLFFSEVRDALQHAFYPEVAISWREDQAELLVLTDTLGDYTLHEPALAGERGANEFNENPNDGAKRVLELVERYLALHPHERANLSVLLYNCDSARLPIAVVARLGALSEGDEEARCQVVLRHREPAHLRALYEKIVTQVEDTEESIASESSRDFMARLRIGIMADQAGVPDPRDGLPQDIVFSQDVISRHARLEWYLVDATPLPPERLNPASYSRRQPVKKGDMRSVVYLSAPVQRSEGWVYLTALATFFNKEFDPNEPRRYLPARQLDFSDAATSAIFRETHNLGQWVVNHDELLDRHQLQQQGVQVIRYKQTSTQGRNLVISSKASLGLLDSMIGQRLQLIAPEDLTAERLRQLAQKLRQNAGDLSGDIVMRAARRGRAANELIGLVLSSYLVKWALAGQVLGWFFLDDYASWLGQREEHIADLMALAPRVLPDGRKRLTVVVTEAKFIDPGGLKPKREESKRQLLETLRRFAGALTTDPPRLDRDVWLARLADMVVDGCREQGIFSSLPQWRHALRAGDCEIELIGYSHVFLHSATTFDEVQHLTIEEGDFRAYQTVYPVETVRTLLAQFLDEEEPLRADADRQQDTLPSAAAVGAHAVSARPEVSSVTNPADDTPPATAPDAAAVASAHWAYPEVAHWLEQRTVSNHDAGASQTWLQSTEGALKAALQGFKLQAKLLSGRLTPNAALLRFQGSALLTVKEVLSRRTEFLTTYGLDVIGVQPEPGALAISIARPEREVVALDALWSRWKPDSVSGNQTLLIGVREDNGELFTISPGDAHAPHTLIAGTTGSGKSVLLQNILLSLAATNRPDQARITLIDPKQGVDYYAFEGLPHLDGGVIDTQGEALERINALVEEMDERYRRFRTARANNLRAYNARIADGDRLPTLWLVHDEFAEWMLDDAYKTQVAAAVARLGVKARAAGIHLIFAAQRPDASVMPMQLRDNLGNRLILRVNSEGTSEIALGERGAERLLGRGHLLARLDGETGLVYAQVPFIADQAVDAFVQSCIVASPSATLAAYPAPLDGAH